MKTTAAVLALALCLFPLRAGAESFASWSAKAAKAEKRGDAVGALEAYAGALRLWTKKDGKKAKAKILTARARLYVQSGSSEAALKDLETSLKLDPTSSATHYRKGRIELDLGNTSDAISAFYKATKLNLNYREAYLYRGFAYQRQGDASFAKEDFKTACRFGLKAACTEAARAKALAASAGGAEGFQAASGPVDEGVTTLKKPAKKRAAKPKGDWKACVDGLSACIDAGSSFGDCVSKAKSCEEAPGAGCCPQECLTRYNELVDQGSKDSETGLSEAGAFRQVFAEKPNCSE
jgi:tetratricopeptide (TPR) repeat protein